MAGMYFADNIHVEKTRGAKGETVQVDTPIGSMRVQEHKKLDPKLIGVPVYPGAIREDETTARPASISASIPATRSSPFWPPSTRPMIPSTR